MNSRARSSEIRIVFENISGYIPTAMVALTLEDAENLCDKLNRCLGLDRDARTAMVAASMRAGHEDPESGAWH